MEYIGHPVHRGQNCFPDVFYVYVKNINLPIVAKLHLKKIFYRKGEKLGFPFFLSKNAANLEISLYRCILSLR
jgi:hypothetical protein